VAEGTNVADNDSLTTTLARTGRLDALRNAHRAFVDTATTPGVVRAAKYASLVDAARAKLLPPDLSLTGADWNGTVSSSGRELGLDLSKVDVSGGSASTITAARQMGISLRQFLLGQATEKVAARSIVLAVYNAQRVALRKAAPPLAPVEPDSGTDAAAADSGSAPR
jgi:hypothetical protein